MGEVGRRVDYRPDQLGPLLQQQMGGEKIEHARMLYLDDDGSLLRDDVLDSGGATYTDVPFRRIVRDGFVLDARFLIFVHNHPSGDPAPSDRDIATTRRLYRTMNELQMRLFDHFVIGADGWFSFRQNKML